MDMKVTEEEKKRLLPFILIVLMLFVIAGFTYLWNKERSARIKLENDKGVIATIEGIEQPGLSEVRERDNINSSIDAQMAEGNTRLEALYNLENDIRSGREKHYVSEKDNINTISRRLAAMGISNTVVFGQHSSIQAYGQYSTYAKRSRKARQ